MSPTSVVSPGLTVALLKATRSSLIIVPASATRPYSHPVGTSGTTKSAVAVGAHGGEDVDEPFSRLDIHAQGRAGNRVAVGIHGTSFDRGQGRELDHDRSLRIVAGANPHNLAELPPVVPDHHAADLVGPEARQLEQGVWRRRAGTHSVAALDRGVGHGLPFGVDDLDPKGQARVKLRIEREGLRALGEG